MVSDATIHAIEQSIDDLNDQYRDVCVRMKHYRQDVIHYFRKYKAEKAGRLQLEAEIKDLKEDLKRLEDGG